MAIHRDRQLREQISEEWGWTPTANAGEFAVIRAFRMCGIEPPEVEQQFRCGPYRLDFAFVKERVCVEADSWPHTSQQVIRRDSGRDRQLREWGWKTYRIRIPEEDMDAEEVSRQVRNVVDGAVRFLRDGECICPTCQLYLEGPRRRR